jgi:hypothetical protein
MAPAGRGIALSEALEHVRQELRFDTEAVVRDRDLDTCLAA